MYEFKLDKDQIKLFKKWKKKFPKKGREIGIGGRYTFSFTPTGVGTGIIVKDCVTKKKLDLSFIDEW